MISSFLEQFAPGKADDLQALLYETGSIAAGMPPNRFLHHLIEEGKSDYETIDGDLFVFVHKSFTKLERFFEQTVRDKGTDVVHSEYFATYTAASLRKIHVCRLSDLRALTVLPGVESAGLLVLDRLVCLSFKESSSAGEDFSQLLDMLPGSVSIGGSSRALFDEGCLEVDFSKTGVINISWPGQPSRSGDEGWNMILEWAPSDIA